MTRGEVWTLAGGPEFAGKPRPAVILQDDLFDATRSVTLCPVTSSETDARSIRPVIEPSVENGLRVTSRLMVDKITTVARPKLQQRVGRLSADEMARMNRAVVVFLGLADAPSR
jgi:mRNA interferase MazF